jgi:predicted dinucleotide-binding enzyme
MKIATIGAGNIGGTLGALWAAKGHEVFFSSRNPQGEKMQALLQTLHTTARVGTVTEAISFADVLVLAAPAVEVDQILQRTGNFKNKILINCLNRWDGKSSLQEVVKLAKSARVVRAFHLLPWELLTQPKFDGIAVSSFMTGVNEEAVDAIAQLTREIGLDPVVIKTEAAMQELEAGLASLWKVFNSDYNRDFGIRLLRRSWP